LLDPIEEAFDEIALPVEPKRCLRLERLGMLAQIFLAAAASRMALLS